MIRLAKEQVISIYGMLIEKTSPVMISPYGRLVPLVSIGRMNSKMFSVSRFVQISSIMKTNKSEVLQWQTIIASIVVRSFQALLP